MERKPIKSPMQAKAGSPLFLVKLAADLLKVHRDFLSKVDIFIKENTSIREEISRINKLPEGKQGPRGPQGLMGPAGKDGRDGLDGKDGFMPDLTIIADLVKAEIPKTQEVPVDLIAARAVQQIEDRDLLKIDERFKKMGLDIASYRNQLAMGQRQPQAGKIYGKNTWARGGGSGSTSSGKNVTTQYLLTAVQAGSDITIDLTQLTNWATFDQIICVYRNNIPQTEGANYNFTKSGSTLTIFNADAGEIFNITYAYT